MAAALPCGGRVSKQAIVALSAPRGEDTDFAGFRWRGRRYYWTFAISAALSATGSIPSAVME